jgi:hypothetical protein
MTPHFWVDELGLHTYRHTIETLTSPMEKRGLERLHARTNSGA